MKPSVIFAAVLSGLTICYVRGDFTKAAIASLGVLDLADMVIFVVAIGTLSFLIVKGWDKLMRRHKRVVRPANGKLQGNSGTRNVRWSDDIGSGPS